MNFFILPMPFIFIFAGIRMEQEAWMLAILHTTVGVVLLVLSLMNHKNINEKQIIKYRIVPVARWSHENNNPEIKWEVQKKSFLFWVNIGGKWLNKEEAEIYLTHHIKEL